MQLIHTWREAEESARKLDIALAMAVSRGDAETAIRLVERLAAQRRYVTDRLSVLMLLMHEVAATDGRNCMGTGMGKGIDGPGIVRKEDAP